jgi:hypothetical protein
MCCSPQRRLCHKYPTNGLRLTSHRTLTPLDELLFVINEKNRRIFVAENPIDLTVVNGNNHVYVLDLPGASSGSAGGRIGGIGERRIVRVICFREQDGKWTKESKWEDQARLEDMELPYHAAGLSVLLPDGTEKVVSGVIDEELVRQYENHNLLS